MTIRLGGSIVAAVMLACVLWWSACNSCPFGLISSPNSGGTVPCCGGFERHDILSGPSEATEFDVSLTANPSQTAVITAWLTSASCEQLFAGAYDAAGASPQCEVLIGPVSPGQVSARRKLVPGPYRMFVQASAANAGKVDFIANVGFWGKSCQLGIAGP